MSSDVMQEDHSKPVNATQGTRNVPPHPAAIHDKYPPIGTKEHAEFHGLPLLKKYP